MIKSKKDKPVLVASESIERVKDATDKISYMIEPGNLDAGDIHEWLMSKGYKYESISVKEDGAILILGSDDPAAIETELSSNIDKIPSKNKTEKTKHEKLAEIKAQIESIPEKDRNPVEQAILLLL